MAATAGGRKVCPGREKEGTVLPESLPVSLNMGPYWAEGGSDEGADVGHTALRLSPLLPAVLPQPLTAFARLRPFLGKKLLN